MKIQAFIHQHYSPEVGESPIGHAAAVVAGLALMTAGAALLATIVWIPQGTVIGLLGLLILSGGVFAHIQSPLEFNDLADAVVKLTGAAIAMTFGLAVAAIVVGFTVTVIVNLIGWLAR